MFGTLEFSYKGRNGHFYNKKNTTAAEIRRIFKRVQPSVYSVWCDTDEGFICYWNCEGIISLQARSITYIGTVAERYNGITKIHNYPYEYTSC